MVEVNYLENVEEVKKFRDSPRGQHILAQALYLGIKALYLYPGARREVSNALDMKLILDTLHPGMYDVFEAIQAPLLPDKETMDSVKE
tara:strand:+ start:259 stop:522 length:264 start_codon:yes stop_codon:yes gene_type:complete